MALLKSNKSPVPLQIVIFVTLLSALIAERSLFMTGPEVRQDDNAGGYHGYRISGNEVVRNFTALASWAAMKLGVTIKRLSRMSL